MPDPVASEPMNGVAPPAAPPPSGLLALARVRWAVLCSRGRIVAARGAVAGPGVRWDVHRDARLRLRTGSAVGGGSRLHVTDGGRVEIGPGAQLGEGCVVQIQTRAVVGPEARLGDEVVLLDHRPVFADSERPIREQGLEAAPVHVGRRARIGARTVLGAGAVVGDGAQVAGNLVIEDIVPAGARISGAPHPR